jgi:hypothetical protein
MSFNQDLVLEDERYYCALQNSDVEHWKFLSMNRKLGSTLVKGNEKKT